MCGIAGIYCLNGKNNINQKIIVGMCDSLEHRGPDDEGYYLSGNIGLGMRRLSIIDLETGHQPIANEKKNIWVVCNGEIYNYQKIQSDLKTNHNFSTKSDVEVIAHLYEEHGSNCVHHLRGMFAFAVLDEIKKELFLARDRIGKKPLYYTQINQIFYFASEMKSFLNIPGFKRRINLKAIHYYLNYQYIPGPMTIWEGVFRLDPASYMVINAKGIKEIKKYWDVDFSNKIDLSFSEAKKRLRSILVEATRLRMIADVPLGVFLSGGVDSSIITALMSQLSNKPIKTFSIGFEDKEFSELEYSRAVANKYKTDHHEIIVKPDYISLLPKIVWHYDQPFADCSALPSYIISQATRQYVKVALNGDGGDENFSGYFRYKALKISQCISLPFKLIPDSLIKVILNTISTKRSTDARKITRYLHRFIKPLKNPPYRRNLIWNSFFTNELKSFIYSDEMTSRFADDDSYSYLENKFINSPANNTIDKALYTDLTAYLPENLLIKMDIASMASSLEARSPFLDQEFIEFTSKLPASWKIKGLSDKYILKETFKDILPENIQNRHKQGFSLPLGKWFRKDLKEYLVDIVLSSKAIQRGYFNKHNLSILISDHIEGRADYGYCLWVLLMLELWHNKFID